MTPRRAPRSLSLGDLIGQPVQTVRARLGASPIDRRLASERWLIYDFADMRLRIRLTPVRGRPEEEPRVASWTATFLRERPRLAEIAGALGLGLEDELEPVPHFPQLRRSPLTDPDSGNVHSLTARVRDGRVLELTAFDEAPEWRTPREVDEP